MKSNSIFTHLQESNIERTVPEYQLRLNKVLGLLEEATPEFPWTDVERKSEEKKEELPSFLKEPEEKKEEPEETEKVPIETSAEDFSGSFSYKGEEVSWEHFFELAQADKRPEELSDEMIETAVTVMKDEGLVNHSFGLATPLTVAVSRNNQKFVTELLKAGADADLGDEDPEDLEHPLLFSAYTGNYEIFKQLVDAGADIDVMYNNEYDVLLMAIIYRRFNFIKSLITEYEDKFLLKLGNQKYWHLYNKVLDKYGHWSYISDGKKKYIEDYLGDRFEEVYREKGKEVSFSHTEPHVDHTEEEAKALIGTYTIEKMVKIWDDWGININTDKDKDNKEISQVLNKYGLTWLRTSEDTFKIRPVREPKKEEPMSKIGWSEKDEPKKEEPKKEEPKKEEQPPAEINVVVPVSSEEPKKEEPKKEEPKKEENLKYAWKRGIPYPDNMTPNEISDFLADEYKEGFEQSLSKWATDVNFLIGGDDFKTAIALFRRALKIKGLRLSDKGKLLKV